MKEVALVRTGTANIASVNAAFARLGIDVRVADADRVARAGRLIVPGVGTLAAAMKQLDQQGIINPLRERLLEGRPTLVICLGLHMLLDGSDESPSTPGLGIVPGRARRFSRSVPVPQFGWNRVAPEGEWFENGYAYFANSYYLPEAPAGWQCAWTEYDGRFVSAMRRGAVWAFQFHPELSDVWGQQLISQWFEEGGSC